MKKIIFLITILLLSINNVNAEACDAYDIKRLKEIAEGIEITYELQEPIEDLYSTIYDRYKINITGITEEVVVVNETDDTYYNSETNFNEIDLVSSGTKKILVESKYCDRTLRKISLKLPVYNIYYNSDTCKEEKNKGLSVCQEWVEDTISQEQFIGATTPKETNNNETKINPVYIKYIITSIIIILILIVISLIIKKKKERLE